MHSRIRNHYEITRSSAENTYFLQKTKKFIAVAYVGYYLHGLEWLNLIDLAHLPWIDFRHALGMK